MFHMLFFLTYHSVCSLLQLAFSPLTLFPDFSCCYIVALFHSLEHCVIFHCAIVPQFISSPLEKYFELFQNFHYTNSAAVNPTP